MSDTYQALVVEKNKDKIFSHSIKELKIKDLPDENILIRTHYSTINYKDCLSFQGNPAITRKFPHTPGIDAAGEVVTSTHDDFQKGDPVIIVAQPMGLNSFGGFGQYIRVPASWVMKVTANTNLEKTMAFGTAGYTAALSVDALSRQNGDLKNKKIVVTGATGGLGCIAVALLNKLGCKVTAITGKLNSDQFLSQIGATEILQRSFLENQSGQNLLHPIWDGAIDVAGGHILSTLLKMMNDNASVVATGLVNDTTLNTNLLPFILRGINLLGINAENTDHKTRQETWQRLMSKGYLENLSSLYKVISLKDLPETLEEAIQGNQLGRIVVDMRN